MARLAILKDNGDVIAEFNKDEFRDKLKVLLDKYEFDTAWSLLEEELTMVLRRI